VAQAAITKTFVFSGSEQTYAVPGKVTKLKVVAIAPGPALSTTELRPPQPFLGAGFYDAQAVGARPGERALMDTGTGSVAQKGEESA
jgi:hypothetical protein